jgi:glycosyltransferase involved in cell wall biosynthesis
VLFPGGLQRHQGVDLAIRAFATVTRSIPTAQFHIYGDGPMKPALVALARDLGLADRVRFFQPLAIRDIARVMARSDLGVVPKRADSFGNEAFSTKTLEFMAVGVPLVVARTRIDQHYFDDSVVRFFEPGNCDDLAAAMLEVLGDAELRSAMVSRASAFVAQHSWQRHELSYLDLVDALVAGAAAPSRRTCDDASWQLQPPAKP